MCHTQIGLSVLVRIEGSFVYNFVKKLHFMSKIKQILSQGSQKFGFWIVLGAGAILRLLMLSSRPIWYDEAFSLLYSSKSISAMIAGTLTTTGGEAADIHPLGYYATLKYWLEIWGNSVWAGRLLSVLVSLLTIALVYVFVRAFVEEKFAWVIAGFVALSPFYIHYSQEIRMYALMSFALVLATLSLFKGMEVGKWGWWVVFAVASTAAQYTQQLAAVYLLSLALIPVIKRDRQAVFRTVLAGVGAIVLYLPWLIHLPEQLSTTQVYWVSVPKLSRFLTLFLAFVTGLPLPGMLLWVGFAASLVVLTIGVMASIRIFRQERGRKVFGFWLAYLAFVPPVLLWLVSQVHPVYIERALLTSAIMFAAWVGWLVVHKYTPVVEKGILTAVFVLGAGMGIWVHYTYVGFPYADYQGLGETLMVEVEPDEVIVHSNKLSFLPMYYFYQHEIPQTFVADAEGSASDTLHLATQQVLGFEEKDSLTDAVGESAGVWFLIYQEAIVEAEEKLGLPSHPHLDWLDAHYQLVAEEQWGDLWVRHYRVASP